jgi:hypothetical protein
MAFQSGEWEEYVRQAQKTGVTKLVRASVVIVMPGATGGTGGFKRAQEKLSLERSLIRCALRVIPDPAFYSQQVS